ncbi:MAG: hypothetical protein IJM30_03540 [Thermoguttaceae bacterium]|nr:hypothetical protein [Thermoguttaceae bacterium]
MSKFLHTESNNNYRNSSRRFRLLRFEGLESRRLLSVNILDGSPVCQTTTSSLISDTSSSEDPITVTMRSVAQLDSSIMSPTTKVETENSPVPSTELPSENVPQDDAEDNDPFFERFGVYINGEKYICLWDLHYRPTVGDPRINPIAANRETFRGEPEPGGEVEEYDVEMSITYHGCNPNQQPKQNGVYQLHEGHNSVLSFPGSLEDPESTDFLEVVLPTLPSGYYSIISFTGTASTNDYFAYVPYTLYGNHPVYDGYVHSGSSKTVYIKIVDDRITESDETLSMTLGYPAPYEGITVNSYHFNEICVSVSAEIVDNDGWKIGIVPADGTVGDKTVQEQGNYQEIDYRVSRIDNGSNKGNDLHYLIDVTLVVSGTAICTHDYDLYLKNSDGTRSLITPNSLGRFTVRIQENHSYETIVVQVFNDLVVERLIETLAITVVEAQETSPPITYAIDTNPVVVNIRDNDTLSLVTVQYRDNMSLVSDTEDPLSYNPQYVFGYNWQNCIHWYSYNSDLTLPVAYTSDSTMKCRVTVTGLLDSTQTYQVRMKWTYKIGGTTLTTQSGWGTVSNSIAEVTLNSSFRMFLGQMATYYDLESLLEWEFRTTCENTRGADGNMGSNSNPLYITYKAPTNVSSYNYHSLIHIGCVAASGSACSDAQVFQAIWSVISSKSITKVRMHNGVVENDGTLYYYGRDVDNTGCFTADSSDIMDYLSVTLTSSPIDYIEDQYPSLARQICLDSNHFYGTGSTVSTLLRYKDGICDAWQDFAINLYGLQGIMCNRVSVRAMTANISGGMTALKVNSNLQGQGGVTPRENTWHGHALIQYNGNVYDPSYGCTYGSRETFLTTFITNLHSVGVIWYTPNLGYGRTYHPAVQSYADIEEDFLEVSDDIIL